MVVVCESLKMGIYGIYWGCLKNNNTFSCGVGVVFDFWGD